METVSVLFLFFRCTQGVSRINAPAMHVECRGEDGSPASVPGRFLHIRDERKIHDFYFALCEIEIYGLSGTTKAFLSLFSSVSVAYRCLSCACSVAAHQN